MEGLSAWMAPRLSCCTLQMTPMRPFASCSPWNCLWNTFLSGRMASRLSASVVDNLSRYEPKRPNADRPCSQTRHRTVRAYSFEASGFENVVVFKSDIGSAEPSVKKDSI